MTFADLLPRFLRLLIDVHRPDALTVGLDYYVPLSGSIYLLLRYDTAPLANRALKRSRLTSAATAWITGHQPTKQTGSF